VTRAPRLTALLVAALGAVSGVSVASKPPPPDFPHEVHARLFPVCEGCHLGVVSGRDHELYPRAADCAQCHDGTRTAAVDWPGPARTASMLRFHHDSHRQRLAELGSEVSCMECHATAAPRSRMSVAGARPEPCMGCHTPEPGIHLDGGTPCLTCHLQISEASGVPEERIAGFPRPRSHADPVFLSGHAPHTAAEQATCTVCHARESCERCHANADRLPAVAALARDPRLAAILEGKPAAYPRPPDHGMERWAWSHGATAAGEPATCANCHTRPGCQRCHGDALAAASGLIATLPQAVPGRAPGAALSVAAGSAHPGGFTERHGAWAASGSLDCTRCHAPQRCAECHAGTGDREFHPANFLSRHAMEVFARGSDCQSCHNTERFCQSCHTATGVASGGRMTAAFHTGQPMWVLSHGQAARTGLESCVACHQQSDCLQCHSSTGGWGVNPHGPGFPAARLSGRGARSCRICHEGYGPGRN
jgi:hypothetical protein